MNATTRSQPYRIASTVISIAALAVLIAGVPYLLWQLGGWPFPTSVPTVDAIRDALSRPIPDTVIVDVLAIAAWVGWLLFCWSLLTEALAQIRGVALRRARLTSPFHGIARHLIGSITVLAAGLPAVSLTATPAMAEPATTIVTESQITSHDHPPLRLVEPASRPPDTRDPGPGPNAVAGADYPVVTVERHDSYWAIAERTLGDPMRWREIRNLNVGRTLDDGSVITDATLYSGWKLLLPHDATVDVDTAVPRAMPGLSGSAPDAESTVVVERDDNLWTISEARLEDDLGRDATEPEIGPYWLEVIDANQDRYVQPGNPNLIHLGQVLVLPPTGLASLGPPSAEQTAPPPAPAPLPAPAEDEPPVAAPEVLDDTAAPGDVTASTSTATSAPATTAAPTTEAPSTPAPSTGGVEADTEPRDKATGGTLVPVAAGALSSVVLAVGLQRLLARRRRRFANEHPGQISAVTPVGQRELHREVIAHADEDRIDELQQVIGSLAAGLAATASPRRPSVVRHAAGATEVILDQPDTNPPSGWDTTIDGTVWTFTGTAGIEAFDTVANDDVPSAAPLLVTIGAPEDDAQLYLDLEADGLLALIGDHDVATELARSILTELTLSPLADTIRVVAIGDLVENDVAVLEHLTVADSWDDLTDDLAAWASQSHLSLVENGWQTPFVARAHEPDHDALSPIVVVADHPPPTELAEMLRAHSPAAVAVVVVGELADVASVRCEPDALYLDHLNLACTPQRLDSDELAQMAALLAAAEQPADEDSLDEPAAVVPVNVSVPVDPTSGGDPDEPWPVNEPPGYDVLVRLLGDITVDGGAAQLRPKATAVVAYLALNRSVSTERLEEACWYGSDRTSRRKRLRDVLTEARSAIGSQHIPANTNGSYTAGPRLRTDTELFDWHVNAAAAAASAEAVLHYRAALDLVSGIPFSYPGGAGQSFGWIDLEHLATTWEYRIANIARACAEMYLDAGEPGPAIGVLRSVVHALPLDSAVAEALMRAHLANGDRAGLELAYKEHVAALAAADLGDPNDSIEELRADSL